MLKSLHFFLLVNILLPTVILAQMGVETPEYIVVEASGEAIVNRVQRADGTFVDDIPKAREEAIKSALREAVGKATGLYVKSFESIDAFTLTKSNICSYADGFVKEHEVLNYKLSEGRYLVEIRAKVMKQDMLAKMDSEAKMNFSPELIGDPRVFITSGFSGIYNPLKSAFTEEKFKVTSDLNRASIKVSYDYNDRILFLQTEYLVSETIIFARNFEVQNGQKIEEVVNSAAKVLIHSIYTDENNFLKWIDVKIRNINETDLKNLKRNLRGINNVISITDKTFSAGLAQFEIKYAGETIGELAEDLSNRIHCLKIESYDDKSLNAHWKSSDEILIAFTKFETGSIVEPLIDEPIIDNFNNSFNFILNGLKEKNIIIKKEADCEVEPDYIIKGLISNSPDLQGKRWSLNIQLLQENGAKKRDWQKEIMSNQMLPQSFVEAVTDEIIKSIKLLFFGTIEITPNVSGNLFINGSAYPQNPVLENSRVTIADLIPAEYSLKIVPLDSGLYRVWEEKVKVLAGEMVKRNAEIKPLFKTVYLIANVLNTKIDIDDEYWGVISPGKEAKLELPLGLHNLKASAEGFLDTLVSISILKSDLNKTETLSLNMKKVPVYSILKVASRKNTGKVEINNIYCGVFPGTFDKIIPGMTNISLIANDGTKWDSTFMTDGGEEYNLNYDLLVPPKYGSVFIDSNPQFAHIYINGIDTHDDTPCIIDQIAVGNNAIRIEFHTNCYIDTTINITGNDTLKIFISQNKE